MKITLLYETTDTPWGGINTFFRNFTDYAQEGGELELTSDYRKADLILSAGHYRAPGKLLKKYHLRNIKSGRNMHSPLGWLSRQHGNKKIVFRVDGLRLFYAQKINSADKMLIENIQMADAVVFQSEFSRKCFDELKVNYPKNNCVIHNGTKRKLFYPAEKSPDLSSKITLISNSWSTNERKGFETVALFSELKNVKVFHIGRWPEHIPSKAVELLGVIQEKEVAETLRRGQFFLFPSENEACPNVVIEALAGGLPVLYHNSGGTPELCRNRQFGMPLPENVRDLRVIEAFLNEAVKRFESLRGEIISNLSLFGFEKCFESYLQFLKEALP